MSEVTAPETKLRERLIAACTAEFAAESIAFKPGKLHESKGREGHIGAVYPGVTRVPANNEFIIEPSAYIQLFHKWTATVDPDRVNDPTIIEEWAERIRRALHADGSEGADGAADEHLWYYSVTNVAYPPDPSGQITRLLVTVMGKGSNPALVTAAG